ncbi:MAG TPA: hypothetical protein VLU91_06295 [Nitrososphaerales archaeon]|nr:hypothetical protein [Nitrososphaerales archaeon]
MKVPLALFGSFKPTEWNEEAYTRHPPFVVETVSGRVFMVPRDYETEAALDKISSPLGLKKVHQGHISYLVHRGYAIRALRDFDWYVRRSWRNSELRALWALAYLGERGDWAQSSAQVQGLGELAGLTAKEFNEALQRLFHSKGENGSPYGLSEIASDRRLIQQMIEKKISELPIWTEEMVMSVLCTGPGGSVAELYEAVLAQGLSIGAVYKVAERLKTAGYVYPLRHYRVNERGPMREMLSADCRNCFFGYTHPDSCLEDTLRQIEDVIERDYGKNPTTEERAALYGSVKPIPYASRTNRRVLASLKLMHEIDRMTREGRVSSMLKKIEEGYGVDLPIKMPPETGQ